VRVGVGVAMAVPVGVVWAVRVSVPVIAAMAVHMHPTHSTTIPGKNQMAVRSPCWMVDNMGL
jgi:hypothetical protein